MLLFIVCVQWDPKITTFPGLYLFSLILNPLDFCSVLGLRLISLAAAAVNVVLLYKIRRKNLDNIHSTLAALDAFTIAALPPLYFFSHLYYTDTLSLTTVLLFYIYWQKEQHLQASVYGRQKLKFNYFLLYFNRIYTQLSIICSCCQCFDAPDKCGMDMHGMWYHSFGYCNEKLCNL